MAYRGSPFLFADFIYSWFLWPHRCAIFPDDPEVPIASVFELSFTTGCDVHVVRIHCSIDQWELSNIINTLYPHKSNCVLMNYSRSRLARDWALSSMMRDQLIQPVSSSCSTPWVPTRFMILHDCSRDFHLTITNVLVHSTCV